MRIVMWILIAMLVLMVVIAGIPMFSYGSYKDRVENSDTTVTLQLYAEGDSAKTKFLLSVTPSFVTATEKAADVGFLGYIGTFWGGVFDTGEVLPDYPFLMIRVWVQPNENSTDQEQIYTETWPYTYGEEWEMTVSFDAEPGKWMVIQFQDYVAKSTGNSVRYESLIP